MREELDKELCSKFPDIFRDRHADMRTTAMCWGFDCGDGWYDIISRLCYLIQGHIDWANSQRKHLLENNPYNMKIPDEIQQVVAVQIKEKFGTLRFYYEGGDDYISGLVSMAESMSGVTCEICGNKGKLREGGWIVSRCDDHTTD